MAHRKRLSLIDTVCDGKTILGMINTDRAFDHANQVPSECPAGLSSEEKPEKICLLGVGLFRPVVYLEVRHVQKSWGKMIQSNFHLTRSV